MQASKVLWEHLLTGLGDRAIFSGHCPPKSIESSDSLLYIWQRDCQSLLVRSFSPSSSKVATHKCMYLKRKGAKKVGNEPYSKGLSNCTKRHQGALGTGFPLSRLDFFDAVQVDRESTIGECGAATLAIHNLARVPSFGTDEVSDWTLELDTCTRMRCSVWLKIHCILFRDKGSDSVTSNWVELL